MTIQNPQTCLSAELLRQLSHDELSPAELKDVEDHVSDCERCRQLLEVPQSDSQWQDEIVPILRTPLESPHVAGDHDERGCEGESLESILRLLGPTDDPHMLGRIGSYEVVGVIGRGGMGVVFKAYEGALNRFVAIKMLLPHLAASGAARKRFAREGKAAAAVIDDNVMPIYSVAEWQGVPYLVTQYSRGATLEKRIRDQGPLELKEILRIGMQTARGLAAAHAQGLVHRDVKPSNILLDGTVERALLTDFGLARAVDDASITRTGIIAGTPQYMSPEQARGGSVYARSDLFGLGCVLYAMCTGRPPFRADSSYAILRMITDDEPRSIREINPDIPEWLCLLISRLMAKSPDARFGNALEVAALLEQCLAHVQQPTSVYLPASVVSHAKGRRSIFNVTRKGIIAMLGTIGMTLLGMVLMQATEAPDISGQWTSDEWGIVVLEAKGPGEYDGTFRGSTKGQPAAGVGSAGTTPVRNVENSATTAVVMGGSTGPRPGTGKSGTLHLKWSRLERRFNGTWRTGENPLGFIRKGTTENQGIITSAKMDVMPEDGVIQFRGSRKDIERAVDFFKKGTKENQGITSAKMDVMPEDGVIQLRGSRKDVENAVEFIRKGTTENQGITSAKMDVMPEDGVIQLRGSRKDIENAVDFFTKGTKENQGNEKTPAVIQNSLPEDGMIQRNGSRNDVMNRNGKISLRLVDNEIRGAWTTDKDVQLESGTPRLADLLWRRHKDEIKSLDPSRTGKRVRNRFIGVVERLPADPSRPSDQSEPGQLQMRVFIAVSITDLVHVGDLARITFDAIPQETFFGKVVAIDVVDPPRVEDGLRSARYEAIVSFDEVPKHLVADLTAEVEIEPAKDEPKQKGPSTPGLRQPASDRDENGNPWPVSFSKSLIERLALVKGLPPIPANTKVQELPDRVEITAAPWRATQTLVDGVLPSAAHSKPDAGNAVRKDDDHSKDANHKHSLEPDQKDSQAHEADHAHKLVQTEYFADEGKMVVSNDKVQETVVELIGNASFEGPDLTFSAQKLSFHLGGENPRMILSGNAHLSNSGKKLSVSADTITLFANKLTKNDGERVLLEGHAQLKRQLDSALPELIRADRIEIDHATNTIKAN